MAQAALGVALKRWLWLLEQAHVATVPGTPFGAPGYLRLSYASGIEAIDLGIAAMKRAVEAIA